MLVNYSCLSCGHKADIEGAAPPACPKCGKALPPASGSSPSLPTMVEVSRGATGRDAGPTGSSARLRHGSGVLPRAIDGYEIVSVLGSGGMGAVFLAYEPLLDREVALKLLAPAEDEQTRARRAARFLSEAVLTGRLGHAGIIPIYRVGFDSAHGYYYVMRYVKGRSLAELLQRLSVKDQALVESYSLNRLLHVFLRVCEAIAFAHRHGIVHRDIKPANIMVAEFGEILVLDWGLAKETGFSAGGSSSVRQAVGDQVMTRLSEFRKRRGSTTQVFLTKERMPQPSLSGTSYLQQLRAMKPGLQDSQNAPITHADQILGTPGYLSPEQAGSQTDQPVTPASDVYALGVTLYEMLTFRLPVEGKTAHEMITQTVLGNVVSIHERPEAVRLPRALCDIVSRAMALKPEDRFRDAAELAEELSLYLEGRSGWKRIADESFSDKRMSVNWSVLDGNAGVERVSSPVVPSVEGLMLDEGASVRHTQYSMGDFRCAIEVFAQGGNQPWTFGAGISEVNTDGSVEPRYEFRLGVSDRAFVELLRNGTRVQRRLDMRLQTNQKYEITLEMEEDLLRLRLDGRKIIEYQEVFPQTGGAVDLHALLGRFYLQRFTLTSRGAPLSLSFMVLPNRLYRTGRYAEARELYRQLAASHPDREEGMLARYKAGLCSTALGDIQDAFGEFTRLEGTMYDHCCALGLAQIGMLDGNIEWAWEALKNGFRRHRSDAIRNEMWFALLGLIDHLGENRSQEKSRRYSELIGEFDPEPQELGRVTCDLLDMIRQNQGYVALRKEAINLLQNHSKNVYVAHEVLLAMCRAGIDQASIVPVSEALDTVMKQRCTDESASARFHILRGEVLMASGDLDEAFKQLRNATTYGESGSAATLWARGWQALILYLKEQYVPALTATHEILVHFRRSRINQLGYFRLIEGLSYFGKQQSVNALTAFTSGAEIDGLWGQTAHHILDQHEAAALCELASRTSTNQLVEALFLAGEAHLLWGNHKLAWAHYKLCLDPARERAMISRVVKHRVAELTKRFTLAELT